MFSALKHHFIPFNMHPFLPQTIAFICGIFLQKWLATPFVFAFGITLTIITIAGYITLQKKLLATFCLLSLICTCGSLRYYYQQKNHADFFSLIADCPFDTQATVTSIVPMEQARMKWCITVLTENIQTYSTIQTVHNVSKTIQIYTSKKPNIQVQDVIKIKNLTLKKASKDSYNNYLIKEDIAATLFLPTFDFDVIKHPTYSFARTLYYFKENLLSRCKKKLSPQTFAFFSSVFLGNRQWGKKHMEKPKEYCKTWGISHYLARSGLHMVIFIFAWHLLLNLLPISLRFKEIFLIFLSILYYMLSWSSISFIRAFFSFILYKSCSLLKLPSQLLHLLTIVTFLVLLFNPMQLFFLDFQLSFGLTFALAWFNHIHNKKLTSNMQKC